MFLLGIKVLHAVFPHFLSVVLVHRSATRAFSRVIRFTSLSNTQVRPHGPLQGLQNLIRTSQSLFSNFCGLPVGKIAEKRGTARVVALGPKNGTLEWAVKHGKCAFNFAETRKACTTCLGRAQR